MCDPVSALSQFHCTFSPIQHFVFSSQRYSQLPWPFTCFATHPHPPARESSGVLIPVQSISERSDPGRVPVFHFYRVRNISPLQFAQSEGYPAQPWARISRVRDLFSYRYGQRYISILTSLYLEIEIDWICTVTYIYVKRNNNKAPPLTFVAVLHWRNAIPSYLFPFPPRQFCLHRSPRITFPSLYNYISVELAPPPLYSCSHPFRYCRPSADSLSDLYQVQIAYVSCNP